jgi:hypothetical protein
MAAAKGERRLVKVMGILSIRKLAEHLSKGLGKPRVRPATEILTNREWNDISRYAYMSWKELHPLGAKMPDWEGLSEMERMMWSAITGRISVEVLTMLLNKIEAKKGC